MERPSQCGRSVDVVHNDMEVEFSGDEGKEAQKNGRDFGAPASMISRGKHSLIFTQLTSLVHLN